MRASPRGWGGRGGPILASLVMVVMSLAVVGVASAVVDGQEDRLLRERTREVAALISNSMTSITSSLQVLGALGSLQNANASRMFTMSAAPLVKDSAVGFGVAVRRGDSFVVVAAAGDVPAVGTKLTGERAALLMEAHQAAELTPELVTDPQGKRLILALGTAGARDAVAYRDSLFQPAVPLPQTPESPFRELRIALYASEQVDPSRLMLSTEARVPLAGEVHRVPFPMGSEQWLLAVGARKPLLGTFTRSAPWILGAAGLVTALSALAAMSALYRRKSYALKLVDDRTRELDEARSFLERLSSAAPVVVRRLTLADYRPSYVSPNVERVFGLTQQEALTLPFGELIHPADWSRYEAAHRRVADGESARQSVEYRMQVAGGHRWVAATFVPETDDSGGVAAVISYVIDVDARKAAEHAQHEAQQAADAANRAKSEFLSRMSHELRTPLNAVLGFAQLLEMDLPPEHLDSVYQIRRAGRHLLDLINEVLDIARIEAGEMSLSPEALKIGDLLAETAELMGPIAAERGVTIRVAAAEAGCHIRADRQRTKQVLVNLVANAIKYNKADGAVDLRCIQREPGMVSIEVRDTGIGIPEGDVGRLFVPFERLGAAQSEVEGTGVGLALSQRLAHAMGGRIDVRSVVASGSTFTLILPSAPEPALGPRAHGRIPRQALPGAADVRRTVLSVEDNPANSRLLERIVSRRPGWRLAHAGLGQLALDMATTDPPDLILLDMHLPDMQGDEVLRRLKAAPQTAGIPVAILTADVTPGQVDRMRALGAAAYLTKPIDVAAAFALLDSAAVSPPH